MALRRFPLMAPVDGEGKVFRGYLPVHNNEYLIEIHLPHDDQGMSIYGIPELRHRLEGVNGMERLGQYDNITLLVTELKSILEESQWTENTGDVSVRRCKIIMSELKDIGFSRVSSISEDMNDITFQVADNGHLHTIRAHIPANYPLTPPKIVTDGPAEDEESKAMSLHGAVKHHIHLFEKYRDYFACMDELDKQTRVLDPDQPSGKDSWRRMALTNHCSLHLEVNPKRPREFKAKRFFGSEKNIEALHQVWDTRGNQWDTMMTPYQNLCRILGGRLMAKIDDQDQRDRSDDVECAICYSYKLHHASMGMLTPTVICSNVQCNRGFHPTCIYEWLRSNPATTRSFNVLFGKCPYCNEKITTEAVL